MTSIQVLKRYEYKGLNIAIRLIGPDVIEYLFAYKGSIYTQSYDRWTQAGRKKKLKEIGAATMIVANAAEYVADLVLQKHSLLYKLGPKRKVATPNIIDDQKENTSEGEHQGERSDQGNGSTLETPKQDDQVGQQGTQRPDGQESGSSRVSS